MTDHMHDDSNTIVGLSHIVCIIMGFYSPFVMIEFEIYWVGAALQAFV